MIGGCAVPLLSLKMEHLSASEGAAIAILFINYIIPIMIGTQILFMGPYDYVTVRVEKWLKSIILPSNASDIHQSDSSTNNKIERKEKYKVDE